MFGIGLMLKLFFSCFIMVALSGCGVDGHSEGAQSIIPYEDRPCTLHANLYAELSSREGIFIAEIHGQRESAQLVGCIATEMVSNGRSVTISLELPQSEKSRETSWENGLKSSTVGTAELRCAVSHIASDPNINVSYHVKVAHLTNDGNFDLARYERDMGEAILEVKQKSDFLIAVGGNLHASRAVHTEYGEEIGRAGSYLPESVVVTSIENAEPGQARYCAVGGGCGIYDIGPKQGGVPFSVRVARNPSVDIVYTIPTFTPSSDQWDEDRCRSTKVYSSD